MIGKYSKRAMYIPYAVYALFSILLFIFNIGPSFSSVLLWYIILSNTAVTYMTFKKSFSRRSHGYCVSFFMLILITLFSALHHCIGSMQMVFFTAVCVNSLYSSIGINVFEIVYVTVLYLSYLIFARSEIMVTAGSVSWLYIRFFMLYIGFVIITIIIVIQKKIIKDSAERNEVAQNAMRVKSDFLANMSHEIRTPMNAVLGMVELALRCDMSEEAREYVNNIRSAGKNLLDIINDILDFSKMESGKMQIVEVEYEIMSLMNDVVNITHSSSAKKNLEFTVEAPADMPRTLFGDELRIKQAVLNFLSNAVKYTHSGAISIRMSYFKKNYGINLMISVSDTGIGIKEEDMSKLFNSFQQLDTHKNRLVEGTGLGLCVTKQLIELMNGFVNVRSVYGKGSEFWFVLPQSVIDKRPCVHIEDVESYTIAVCEENIYARESIAKTLRDLKIKNFICDNVDELLEYISENQYTHIFVEYKTYMANKVRFKNIDTLKIAALHNANEFVDHSENIRFLCKPVYHLTISKILSAKDNNKIHGVFAQIHRAKFTAPQAKVLIVDDNLVNLRVAEGLLKPYNMKIQTVTSGTEAIDRVKEEKFDIVFMDHMMPEMDGVEATKVIRSLAGEYYENLVIIALTANAISGAKDFFIENGMNDFISKPIEMRDMESRLRAWLPKEKIVMSDSEEFREESATAEMPDTDAAGIAAGDEINFNKGLRNCGENEELYLSIIKIYIDDVDSKAKLIKEYRDSGDIDKYTVEVHALKSASRSIGAERLSVLAENLEKAGKENNASEINNKTDALIEKYLKTKSILTEFYSGKAADVGLNTENALKNDALSAETLNFELKKSEPGTDNIYENAEIDTFGTDSDSAYDESDFLFRELDAIISEADEDTKAETAAESMREFSEADSGVYNDTDNDNDSCSPDTFADGEAEPKLDSAEYTEYSGDNGNITLRDDSEPDASETASNDGGAYNDINTLCDDNANEEVPGGLGSEGLTESKNGSFGSPWSYGYAFGPFEELEIIEKKGLEGKAKETLSEYNGKDGSSNDSGAGDDYTALNLESEYDKTAYDEEPFEELERFERNDGNLSSEERLGFSINAANSFNNIEYMDIEGVNAEPDPETETETATATTTETDIDVSSDGIKRVISEMRRAVRLENSLSDTADDKSEFYDYEDISIHHDGEKYIMPERPEEKLKKIHAELLPDSETSDTAKCKDLCFKVKEFKSCMESFNIPTAEDKLFEIGANELSFGRYRGEFDKLKRIMINFDYDKAADLCGEWIEKIERECGLW